MYKLFIKSNRRLQETKGLELLSRQKHYPHSLEKSIAIQRLGLKVGMHVFLLTILQEHKNPFSSYITCFDFYPAMFMHGTDSVSSFCWRK